MPNDIVKINNNQILEGGCKDVFIENLIFNVVKFNGTTPAPEVTITGPLGTIDTCKEVNIFVAKVINDRQRGIKNLLWSLTAMVPIDNIIFLNINTYL